MAFLVPTDTMAALTKGVLSEIREYFPYEGSRNQLKLDNIYLGDRPGKGVDVTGQKKAKLAGRTWSVPVFADLRLLDKEGKVIDKATKVRIANIPQITQRYSYIVEGREHQVDNQWRLKSGVYSRIKENGQLEATFNLATGRGFNLGFNPKRMRFSYSVGTTNVPAYSVLKALGAKDDQLRAAWGPAIYASNIKASKYDADMRRIHKAFTGRAGTAEEGIEVLKEQIEQTQLRPDTTKLTLGKAFDKVNDQVIIRASQRLLGLSRGEGEPDRRDALQYKELLSIDDLLSERIKNSGKRIKEKIGNNVDRKKKIREIVEPGLFNFAINSLFSGADGIAPTPSQTNPLEMISNQMRTTVMGPGGISDPHKVTMGAKLVDPSHIGFLDPNHTPEGDKTGITLHLALGVEKDGRTPTIQAYDLKTGKVKQLDPETLAKANVAFPDQYTWKDGKPTPGGTRVKVSGKDNFPREVGLKEVDYVLLSSKRLFSVTANMVPFLQNDQGNRVEMAARHLEQAISLKDREPPLVQVSAGGKDPGLTFEKVFGTLGAHRSGVTGTVTSVKPGAIRVKDAKGKLHTYQTYDHYPLNDGASFLNAEPVVKVGDKVARGDLIADNNYTKDGTLSLGLNLRAAYFPFKGYTFEDGIAISESASQRLTSSHLRKKTLKMGNEVFKGLNRYRAQFPDRITDKAAETLDAEGIIKEGTVVSEGDFLVAALRKADPTPEARLQRGIHKSLIRPFKDHSLVWHGTKGVVQEVVQRGKEILVLVKTEESAQVGDKVCGRHGNKGVITRVLPDHEMPHDKAGKIIDIVMSPRGVAGRMNLGQTYETIMGKIAKKIGEPIAVSNFELDVSKRLVRVRSHTRKVKTKDGWKFIQVKAHNREMSYRDLVEKAAKQYNVSPTEQLFDPTTGAALRDDLGRDPLVGQQYILKLEHQAAKKRTARSAGHGFDYTVNKVPKGGGTGGAQSLGELGLYGMLSHGATANIRDMYTVKSDYGQEDAWTALQAGESLPPPRPTFAYEKFTSYLNTLGLNIEKQGNSLTLIPFTDAQMKDMSNGDLARPALTLRAKDLKPEKGGLFDEQITGGVGGKKWSTIKLAEQIPNPMFEKAIQSLTGLKRADYAAIVSGTMGVNDDGELVDSEDADHQASNAIKHLLSKIDVKGRLKDTRTRLKVARKGELNKLNRQVKILRALDKNNLDPSVYMLSRLPVLPPQFRPISVLPSGDLNDDDLNRLYKDASLINTQLGKMNSSGVELPDEEKNPLRAGLYDSVKALYGISGAPKRSKAKGILELITPTKRGFFQGQLMQRKQDLTGRAVIVPEDSLSLDEVGVPRDMARVLYKPFVVRELVRQGFSPLQAGDAVDAKQEAAERALEFVVKDRPILLKRDPVLHKFGILAFKPKLVDGNVIQIHPMVTVGFNADFDGDQMSLYVPMTNQAKEEAYKLFPSRNLYSPATGRLMYSPGHESLIGLNQLSRWGKKTGKRFKTAKDAIKAARDGVIGFTDEITVGNPEMDKKASALLEKLAADRKGHWRKLQATQTGKTQAGAPIVGRTWVKETKTTAGRLLINSVLPKEMQGGKLLTDKDHALNDKKTFSMLTHVSKNHEKDFGEVADALKDMGFAYGYRIGYSFDLNDIDPKAGAMRDKIFKQTDIQADKVRAALPDGPMRDAKLAAMYATAAKKIDVDVQKYLATTNNRLSAMGEAGVKPKWNQIKQMLIGPLQLKWVDGKLLPAPVRKGYGEGLDTSDYMVASAVGREALIDKVVSVSDPGALSKEILNTTENLVITKEDCGTHEGISLPTSSHDVLDRFLAKPVVLRDKTLIPKDTLITPEIASEIMASKISKIVVRSALKCQASRGLCQHCFGLDEFGKTVEIGRNVGAIAAQSLGERLTQSSMRTFHTGGQGSKGVIGLLARLKQLLRLQEIIPGSATLAETGGTVGAITKSPAGGWNVDISGEQHYIPQDRGLTIVRGETSHKLEKGDRVRRGQPISGGPINPRELLPLAGISSVQNYLANEIATLFAEDGVRARNAEVVVKALTRLGKVEDAGDHEKVLRGDLTPVNQIMAWNKEHPDKNPVIVTPILKGVKTAPLSMQEDWLARMQFQRLGETLVEASMQGWSSDIHSEHPTPALIYAAEFGESPKDKPWAY